MKINEIIKESADYPEFDIDDPIEDEADSRGDSDLIDALEFLRNQEMHTNAVTPRVKVDTVIRRVWALQGNEAFNFAALDAAKKDNEAVKNIIKDIKDDPQTGKKYVYLNPPENTVGTAKPDDSDVDISAEKSDKIVKSMAKRAAA
jgi:hypothetical protein